MRTFKIKKVSNTGAALVLNTDISADTITLCNCEQVRLVICTCIPASNDILPVELELKDELIPLQDKIGNVLHSDQIRSCVCYTLVFGTFKGHLKMLSCVPKSQAAPCCITYGGAK